MLLCLRLNKDIITNVYKPFERENLSEKKDSILDYFKNVRLAKIKCFNTFYVHITKYFLMNFSYWVDI